MNYEAHIAKLKSKGLLDKKQADTLIRSLSKKSVSVPPKRNDTLEVAGVGILLFLFVCLAIQATIADGSGAVESVASTLNDTRIGIGSGKSFVLMMLISWVVLFAFFYFLVHHYRNKVWRYQEEIIAHGEIIADLEERKTQLEEKMESLLEEQAKREKAKVVINTDDPDATNQVIAILEKLYEELGDLQRQHAMLKAKCRSYSGKFPFSLAGIGGSLPGCQ